MVKLRRVSSIADLSFFSQSDSGLARILADFASSAYTLFADSVFVDLELEEDISMAALEELSFVEVSPFVHTNLPSPSVTPSFNTNMENDLVAAFEQMDFVDLIIGEGPDFLFSPLHSSFLSHHPSFLEDS